jgi:hypothetical protein
MMRMQRDAAKEKSSDRSSVMNETIDLKAEVQELAWAVIDEQATDSQIRRLEGLLLENGEARRTYVECIQMHADLHYLLGGKRAKRPAERNNKKSAKRTSPLEALRVTPSPNVPLCDGLLS